jgi:hypothetical protein
MATPTNTKTTTTSTELSVPIRNEVCCRVATKIISTIFQLGVMTTRKMDEKSRIEVGSVVGSVVQWSDQMLV